MSLCPEADIQRGIADAFDALADEWAHDRLRAVEVFILRTRANRARNAAEGLEAEEMERMAAAFSEDMPF